MNRMLVVAALCAGTTLARAEGPSHARVVVHDVRDITRPLWDFAGG